mmetsp:Transcript_9331/g.27594  ORF Transcript_9331/g.27594 Transcript_9331/m.27594 type:complete len:253 (+) Transcript_9331:2413-3171(+)
MTRRATTAQNATWGDCSASNSASIAKARSRGRSSELSAPAPVTAGGLISVKAASRSSLRASFARLRHFATRKTVTASRHSRTRPRPSRSMRCRSSCSSSLFRCQVPKESVAVTLNRPSTIPEGLGSCARRIARKASARRLASAILGASAPRSAMAAATIATALADSSWAPVAAGARSTPVARLHTASPCGSPGAQSLSSTSACSQTQGASSSVPSPTPSATDARDSAWASASSRASRCSSRAASPSGRRAVL